MDRLTLIDDERVVQLAARLDGDGVRLDPAALEEALGWTVHDGLLCNDAMCVPLADEGTLVSEAGIDLAGFARALDRVLAVDLAERAAFLGGSARERGQVLASQQAPDFTLPDLDGRPHSLSEHRGKKILLVVWASW